MATQTALRYIHLMDTDKPQQLQTEPDSKTLLVFDLDKGEERGEPQTQQISVLIISAHLRAAGYRGAGVPFGMAPCLYKRQMAEESLKPKYSWSHCYHTAAPPSARSNTRTALIARVGADRAGLSSCETARDSPVLLQVQPLLTRTLALRDPHTPSPSEHSSSLTSAPPSRRAEG